MSDPAAAFGADLLSSKVVSLSLKRVASEVAFKSLIAEHEKAAIDVAAFQLNQASEAVRRLGEAIASLERSLDPSKEVQLVIVRGASTGSVFVDRMVPLGADLIRYEGHDDRDGRVMVLQHVTQLNVTLQVIDVDAVNGSRLSYRIVIPEEIANDEEVDISE